LFARCCCDDYNHCYREIGSHKQCPADFGGFDGIEIPSAIGGAENAFFEPFLYRNDPFAKTGSRQTSGKVEGKGVLFFCRLCGAALLARLVHAQHRSDGGPTLYRLCGLHRYAEHEQDNQLIALTLEEGI